METCKCGKRALIGPRGFGSLWIEVSEVLARQFVRLGCCVDQSFSRHIRSSICPNRVGGPLMLNQPRNPRGFGVDDKPRCTNCGTLTFLTRRRSFCDNFKNGWIGRRLPRLFKQHGMTDISIDPQTIIISYPFLELLLGGHLTSAQQVGVVSSADAERWWTDLHAAHEAGTFFYALAALIVAGTKS